MKHGKNGGFLGSCLREATVHVVIVVRGPFLKSSESFMVVDKNFNTISESNDGHYR